MRLFSQPAAGAILAEKICIRDFHCPPGIVGSTLCSLHSIGSLEIPLLRLRRQQLELKSR